MITMHFGDYLISKELVTPEQLDSALIYQREYNRLMGKFAQNLGYISRRDNVRVLLEQLKTGKRYGDIAVEKGYLTRDQVGKVLEIQGRDNMMLGRILMDNGILTRSQLLRALKDFIALKV